MSIGTMCFMLVLFIGIMQQINLAAGLNTTLAGFYSRRVAGEAAKTKFCTAKYKVSEHEIEQKGEKSFSIFTDGDCNLSARDFKREPMSAILGDNEPVPKVDAWVWRGTNDSCLGKAVSTIVFYCHEEEQGIIWSKLNREKGRCYLDLATNETSVCVYQKCTRQECTATDTATTGKTISSGTASWVIWVILLVIGIAVFALVLFCYGRRNNCFGFRKRLPAATTI